MCCINQFDFLHIIYFLGNHTAYYFEALDFGKLTLSNVSEGWIQLPKQARGLDTEGAMKVSSHIHHGGFTTCNLE